MAKKKIKTGTKLTNLEGEVMKQGKDELTLGLVISGALVAPNGDDKLGPIEAMDRYELAMDLRKKDEVELTNEQVKICQEALCASFAPMVSGQACLLLK